MGTVINEAARIAGLYVACGLEVPAAARAVFTAEQAVQDALEGNDLADITAAVAGGKIDEAALIAALRSAATTNVIRDGMKQVALELDLPLGNLALAALRQPETVIDALQAKFDTAAEAVLPATEWFTADTLAQPGEIMRKHVEAGPAWHAAQGALSELDTIVELVNSLVSRNRPSETPVVAYFVQLDETAAVDMTDLWAMFHVAKGRWLTLAATPGVTLRLNSPAEAATVAAGVRARAERRAAGLRPLTPLEQAHNAAARTEAQRYEELASRGV